MTNIKQELSLLEIYGAEVLLNKALNEYNCSDMMEEELFITGNTLNSTSDANGYPIEIEGYNLSHCIVQSNGMLIAVCYDSEENSHYFRVEENSGFYELTQYKEQY